MTGLKYYDNPLSGHAHRPRALLKLLKLDYETIHVDLSSGEHKSAAYRKINQLGEVPALADGDYLLRESTAILVYLASKYDVSRQWLPLEPELAASIQSWLAVSSKEIYSGPCAARLSKVFGAPFDYEQAVENTANLFTSLFEPHLAKNEWLVGANPTIADIANYGYIAATHEADIDISVYPNISAWLKRLEALEGFHKIPVAADVLSSAA